MDFNFSLATPDDDADLRRLLANNAMPGDLTVTFEREPSYFLGCGTMGRFWQVVIAREREHGDIAGVICRATGPHFVNGQRETLGYIGQLRVDQPYRGCWMLTQGMRYLHDLHADNRTRAYFAAIADENRVAKGVLVDHPRPGLPELRPLTHIVTLGIILSRWRWLTKHIGHKGTPPDIDIRRGSEETLPAIIAFLQREGAAKQCFPVYTAADFTTLDTTLGFSVEDFVVAYRGKDIVGVVGLWDQASYKQSVVRAYHGTLRWARPFYNVAARVLGAQPLPAIGDHIRSAYASFICVAGNAPAIFGLLLREIYTLAASRGYAHLMLGLSEQDPLLPVAQRYPHIAYHSHLYTVCWEDAADFHAQLDARIPYIEIAML